MKFILPGVIALSITCVLGFGESKFIAKPSDFSVPNNLHNLQDTLLYEDFEGSFPPTGWDIVEISGTQGGITPIPWHHSIYPDEPYQHSDSGGTSYGWGLDLDGWLRITDIDLWADSTIAISFWWMSSYTWHVHPHDNGDLFVKVSTDAGLSWDMVWTFGDSAKVDSSGVIWPWDDWVWYESTISLKSYAGMDHVMIGFHVVADDNADIGLDDIVIGKPDAGFVNESHRLVSMKRSSFIIQPNPVRDKTVIKFSLYQPSHAKILIHNILGVCVREYEYNDLSAKQHMLQWDGKDNNGRSLTQGVYFITLITPLSSTTKNCILLR
jgi:hypothetical protein